MVLLRKLIVAAFNSGDVGAWEHNFNFPSVRFASNNLAITRRTSPAPKSISGDRPSRGLGGGAISLRAWATASLSAPNRISNPDTTPRRGFARVSTGSLSASTLIRYLAIPPTHTLNGEAHLDTDASWHTKSKDLPILVDLVSTDPIRVNVESNHTGTVRVIFDIRTRHFANKIPLNERLSHRLDLYWLVYSLNTGVLLGQITQDDFTLRFPDIYITLPRDSALVLVPSAPYYAEVIDAVGYAIAPARYGKHAFRYEINVGSSADQGFIGDRWSYREGRLFYMNFFQGKAFRWAFDGAQLVIPTSPNAHHQVRLDAHCLSDVEVKIGEATIGVLSKSTDGQRWHCEDYLVSIPPHLVKDQTTTLSFHFVGESYRNIEFNLRQEAFALALVVVDCFGNFDRTLPARVAEIAWGMSGSGEILSQSLFATAQAGRTTTKARIFAQPIEFELVKVHFAPHRTIWNTLRGLIGGLLKEGSSVLVSPIDSSAELKSDCAIMAPLRFPDSRLEDCLKVMHSYADRGLNVGSVLSLSADSLSINGFATDDSLIQNFAYRELFGATIEEGQSSNFWEFIVTDPTYWSRIDLSIYENVLIGAIEAHPAVILATSSAEDWIENGDPNSLMVLRRFLKKIIDGDAAYLGQLPCSISFLDDSVTLKVWDERHAVRSAGGGIARGWNNFKGPGSSLPPVSDQIRFEGTPAPPEGPFSAMLIQSKAKLEGLKMVSTGATVARTFSLPRASQ